jgi:hypothetical protein
MGKEVPIGAVIEIPIEKEYAYALLSHNHTRPPRYGALLRVFGRLFPERQLQFEWMDTASPLFEAFFPISQAIAQGIVNIAATVTLPTWAQRFPTFRTGVVNPKTGKVDVWWLWDGEKEWRVGLLSPEQRRLSIRGVINDTLLKERIMTGWRPDSDPR